MQSHPTRLVSEIGKRPGTRGMCMHSRSIRPWRFVDRAIHYSSDVVRVCPMADRHLNPHGSNPVSVVPSHDQRHRRQKNEEPTQTTEGH